MFGSAGRRGEIDGSGGESGGSGGDAISGSVSELETDHRVVVECGVGGSRGVGVLSTK